MRKVLTAVLIILGSYGECTATSYPPPPLALRVESADHIFVATVRNLDVLGKDGNAVTNPPIRLPWGTKIRLVVAPQPTWLKTPLTVLPDSVEVTYDIESMVLSFESLSQSLLNKEFIFLLVGSTFSPVARVTFFMEETDALPTVQALIRRTPVPQTPVK